ncbi:Na(+)-translocating NADH-quinone reductase subunit A [Citreimonas salinaria]|uniref:Na+-transporting NADH:ubiquinone oxidoreductase subunit A n=1 Tax=Citreimonas salinaria TaxID=321339 RepID=A0A1H3L0K2_9RHOB|nr:Na(+)-translocating NADH-quinone reductase subunit A [Citreimonas salinaria]SDY57943.1 Na+-transporting NADH:ubiquinone oxidoreductase subunit A [Citreimonas salinaria]
MIDLSFRSGLAPRFASPPSGPLECDDFVTEEAGLRAMPGQAPRVAMEVEQGALVAQGTPIARLRSAPEICFVAQMPARVARIDLLQGHRLSEIVLFREPGGDPVRHDTSGADTEAGLRLLMQNAGLWPWLGRRPFGGMPAPDERPAAIIVMATDTAPLAPDPRQALTGREEAFGRGLHALAGLTDGPVLVCQQPGPPLFDAALAGRVRTVDCGPRHPQGSAGLRAHALCPAGLDRPVWDIHAEDVAHLGDLLATGILPMTRLVRVGGEALREGRLLRAQPGADLRGLAHRIAQPGAHLLLSGSPLDGHEAHWLAPRHRQVTVLPRRAAGAQPHWLIAALTRSGTPKPVIPNAALDQAFGNTLPAAAFVRALGSGDDETAMKMGLLSLLEEDVALADYVLGGDAHLPGLLRAMLDRIRTEFAA